MRLVGTPASIDEAAESRARGRALAGGVPLTGFSLADLLEPVRRRSPRAGGSRARRCRPTASTAVAEVPLDRLGDTENAIEVVRAVAHGGLRSGAPRSTARRSTDRLELIERAAACSARPGVPGVRAAAAPRSGRHAVDRLRRRADDRGRAADVRDDSVHSGGLAAVRPEARAGGDGLRRRRHRRRGRGRRAADSGRGVRRARRSSGRSAPRGASRSSATAGSSRAVTGDCARPPRRGQLSERAAAGLRARAAARSSSACGSTCRRCARGCSRPATIDLGMVPSITYLDRPGDRIVPGVCIGSDGPVASVALFTRRPLSGHPHARARHVVAHIGRR